MENTCDQLFFQAEAMHSKALAEDPTAFDYDGIYDSMKKETIQQEIQIKAERLNAKKPKYFDTILATHKERKREQDIIYNRNLLKEKDKEGNLFGDKEKFVTASYKKKLAEDKLWEEEQQKKEEREGDVNKRKNFEGFYSNFINSVAAVKQAAIHPTKPQQEKKPQKDIKQPEKPVETIQQRSTTPPKEPEAKSPVTQVRAPSPAPTSPKQDEASQQQQEEEKQKRKREEEEQAAKKMARAHDDAAVAEARARYLQRKAAAAKTGGVPPS